MLHQMRDRSMEFAAARGISADLSEHFAGGRQSAANLQTPINWSQEKTPALADRGSPPSPCPRAQSRERKRGCFGASSLSGRRAEGWVGVGSALRCPPPIAVRGLILSDRPRWSWRTLRASVNQDALRRGPGSRMRSNARRAPRTGQEADAPARTWPCPPATVLAPRREESSKNARQATAAGRQRQAVTSRNYLKLLIILCDAKNMSGQLQT